MLAPCKDCPDRKMGCHSTCEKYIEYAKYREEYLKKKSEYHKKNADFWDTRCKGRRKK